LGIRDCSSIARFALKVEGDASTMALGNMAIKGVDRGVDLSADKPLCKRWVPFERGIPLTLPDQLSRLLLPECDSTSLSYAIEGGLSVGLGCKFRAWGKNSIFTGKVVEGLFRHNMRA
jgi:hypothetical protein